MAEHDDVQGRRGMQGQGKDIQRAERKMRRQGGRPEVLSGLPEHITSGAWRSWLAWQSLGPCNTTWGERGKQDELKQSLMPSFMDLGFCQGQEH